jgi:hypothetical protein
MDSTKTLEKMRTNFWLAWGIPFLIVASYGLLAIQADLRLAVPALTGVTAGVAVLLAIGLYAGEKQAIKWTPCTIMFVAVCLRLIFLFRSPELSDDIYRYLWDGLQTLSGHNPYSLPPADSQPLGGTLANLSGQVNHPDLVTIYPPTAQLIFMAGSALGGSVLGIKSLLVVLDLATCAVILRLLSALELPAWRAVLYAWHPLPVLEIAASGHVDGAGLLFFLLGLLTVTVAPRSTNNSQASVSSRHEQLFSSRIHLFLFAGLAFACAGFVKLFSLIFIPGCLILLPGRCRTFAMIGTMIGFLLLTLPFLPDVQNAFGTLSEYAKHWEFGSFAYRSLLRLTVSGNAARWALGSTFFTATILLYVRLYLKNLESGTHCVSKQTLLTAFSVLYNITMAFLLLTPTLHPWYALYLVCFLPFVAGPAGLTFTWSVFLGYRVVISYALCGQWVEDDVTAFMTWVGPVAAFVLITIYRSVARQNSRLMTG